MGRLQGEEGKRVGLDGVPHDLLQQVCQHPDGREGLLAWFIDIL